MNNLSWITGLREVFVKDAAGNRVEYFDDLTKALNAVAADGEYRAVWFSLNICPGVPSGFAPNRLYKAAGRFKKTDYVSRQLLLIDCDPKRKADTAATDAQKAAAKAQALEIRDYLLNLGFPEPIFADSGNGFHLLFAINEPNDEATETLLKDFLAGLSVKFTNDESQVDTGNYDANRICKLYGSVARKGDDPSLWRRSVVLEVPTRSTELPAKEGRAREVVVDLDFEPVPRAVLTAAVAELPVPRDTKMGEMTDDAIRKIDWLRKLCDIGDVAILKERRDGKYFVFDIVCPRAASHGSTTGDTSTIVSYERKTGYGFSCLHGSCSSHNPVGGIKSFSAFRKAVDPTNQMSDRLPGIPDDVTHAKIAAYFAGLDVFKNHLRIYDTKKMITTFVGTRWDLVGQDDLLLMKTLQPVCDRLRYDMFPPENMAVPHDDYRRILESHPFRLAVVGQLKPQSGVVRFDQLDAGPYLIGMPGGMVADLRTGLLRKMERGDFITKRLRLVATNTPTPCYDYFLRSISSENDQPADLEWMSHFELLHGYFLIGHYNFHIWPLWTGVGGNGKSENARLIKSTLGDFCSIVRWSELIHDDRGGDNTSKRLNFKLLQSRVALVEEMGQTSGISRVLETSTIKQHTGGGEIIGADLYRSEVQGEIKFKLVSLMNEAPHIEPDPAFKRRVQVFPFRARFDEVVNPGCVALAMERKHAPAQLREFPDRLSALLREERPGILYKWIQAARRFIDQGEHLRNMPVSVRDATAAMFHETDYNGRVLDRLEFGDESFDLTKGELLGLGETAFRENGQDPRSFNMAKMDALLRLELRSGRRCSSSSRIMRNGQRKEGWRGVRLVPDVVVKL
jgi:hypothetical protein